MASRLCMVHPGIPDSLPEKSIASNAYNDIYDAKPNPSKKTSKKREALQKREEVLGQTGYYGGAHSFFGIMSCETRGEYKDYHDSTLTLTLTLTLDDKDYHDSNPIGGQVTDTGSMASVSQGDDHLVYEEHSRDFPNRNPAAAYNVMASALLISTNEDAQVGVSDTDTSSVTDSKGGNAIDYSTRESMNNERWGEIGDCDE